MLTYTITIPDDCEIIIKKRGVKITVPIDQVNFTLADEEPKRGRGRPRKVVPVVDVVVVEPKRGRGRPRKVVEIVEEVIEIVEEVVPVVEEVVAPVVVDEIVEEVVEIVEEVVAQIVAHVVINNDNEEETINTPIIPPTIINEEKNDTIITPIINEEKIDTINTPIINEEKNDTIITPIINGASIINVDEPIIVKPKLVITLKKYISKKEKEAPKKVQMKKAHIIDENLDRTYEIDHFIISDNINDDICDMVEITNFLKDAENYRDETGFNPLISYEYNE